LTDTSIDWAYGQAILRAMVERRDGSSWLRDDDDDHDDLQAPAYSITVKQIFTVGTDSVRSAVVLS